MGKYITAFRKSVKANGGLWQKGSFDIAFFTLVILIVIVGLVMLYSSTYAYAYYYKGGDSALFFKKQAFWAIVGFVLMIAASRVNLVPFKGIIALLATLGSWGLLCIALLMPAHNGTRRHIYLGTIQFQPSDIAKLALIMTLAFIFETFHDTVTSKKPLQSGFAKTVNSLAKAPVLNDSLKVIVPAVMIIGIYAVLVVAGKHLSGTILILSIGVVMLYLGEIRGKWFFIGILLLVIGGLIVWEKELWKNGVLADYMSERIVAWLDKDFDPRGVRWQTNQALYAIGSGGLFGKGLGQSTMKYMYVSEPQNDMIFSIVVEELGFVGAAAIILLFALLIWRGVVIGVNCRDRYSALVAMGIVFLLGIQVILNIAVATDSVPNTGISLPFFSSGGTALVMNMIEMGLVLNVSRSSKIKRR